MVSRLIHGGRISLSVGLIGVAVSFVLGITLGSISGYFGGITDNIVQRGMEFLRSIPTIPLWMGLAAALPITWDPLFVYFLVTLLLSLIGWTYVARTVRGRFLSIKNEDFVLAARFCGTSEAKIITRHMLPSMTSYIIAALTLAVPDMILGETALSFLGLAFARRSFPGACCCRTRRTCARLHRRPGCWRRVLPSSSSCSPSTSWRRPARRSRSLQQMSSAMAGENPKPIIEIENLKVHFKMREGVVKAVDGVNLSLMPGEVLGVVGESGSGKSVTVRTIMQLLPKIASIADGKVLFNDNGTTTDIAKLAKNSRDMRALRGGKIGMIFQEPMTALSPVHTIGHQVMTPILLHTGLSKREAEQRAKETLDMVRLPRIEEMMRSYPHPAFRRHAPARHDCHCAGLSPEGADRRRANDSPRRDDRSADPRSPEGVEARAWHVDRLHHA